MLGNKESSSSNVLKRAFDVNVDIIILFDVRSVEKNILFMCYVR